MITIAIHVAATLEKKASKQPTAFSSVETLNACWYLEDDSLHQEPNFQYCVPGLFAFKSSTLELSREFLVCMIAQTHHLSSMSAFCSACESGSGPQGLGYDPFN